MHRLLYCLLLVSSANAATYITAQTLGTLRSDFVGWVGIRIHMLQTVTTTQIGTWCTTGDTATHTVKFVLDSGATPTDVPGSSVSIACPGGTAGYRYLAATVTLNKSSAYFLVAFESTGTCCFYNIDTTVTPSAIAALDGGGWYDGQWKIMGATNPRNTAFGPVNFQYTAPTPFSGVSIQDDRGDTTAATRHGVKQRPPMPRHLKLYISGPEGCLVSGTESGADNFHETFWEDAGQGFLQQIPATRVPYTIYTGYQKPEYTSYAGTVGTKVTTITFTLSGTGCSGTGTFTLTHIITNGNPLPNFVYRTPSGAVPSICTNPAGLRDASSCDYSGSDGLDSGSMLVVKNQGDTGTDAAWGHTYTKATSGPLSLPTSTRGWDFTPYSAVTPFGMDSNYLWIETTSVNAGGSARSGSESYLRLTDMTELRNGTENNSNFMIPSTIYHGNVTHLTDQHTIRKRVVNQTTGAATDEDYNVNVSPLFITSIDHGGTTDMTADGWWAFYDVNGQRVCAVDMAGINSSNYMSHIYCGSVESSFGPEAFNGDSTTGLGYWIDTVHASGIDRRSGKRYIVALNNGSEKWGVYTVNLATHVLDPLIVPESPTEGHEVCPGSAFPHMFYGRSNGDGVWQAGECGIHSGHSDFADFDGKQFWVGTIDFNIFDERWMIAIDLSTGADMTKPADFGGGLYMLNRLGDTGTGAENHESCAPKAGICSWGYYKAVDPGGAGTIISSISAANPAVITTSGGHGWGTGSRSVVVGGLSQSAFRTCAMGKFSATVTDSTHITLTGANCTGAGTYSGGSGMVGEVFNNTNARYAGEAHLSDLHHIIRAINMRQYKFGPYPGSTYTNDGYYVYPEPALSQDGTKLAFHSTMGLPENATWIADTGWTAASAIKQRIQPTHNGATASVVLPVAKACTWTVFTDAITTVQSTTTSSSTVHHVVLTGESANTNYLLRVTCGIYSSTEPFRTAATPTGTGTIAPAMLGIAGAADIVFDYGTTAALGSTSAASTCDIGAQCRAAATLNKGLWYIQPRIRNGSAATIATGPLTEIRN